MQPANQRICAQSALLFFQLQARNSCTLFAFQRVGKNWHSPIAFDIAPSSRKRSFPITKRDCLSTECRRMTMAGDEVMRIIANRSQLCCRQHCAVSNCSHALSLWLSRVPVPFMHIGFVFVLDDFPLRQANSVRKETKKKKNANRLAIVLPRANARPFATRAKTARRSVNNENRVCHSVSGHQDYLYFRFSITKKRFSHKRERWTWMCVGVGDVGNQDNT